MLQKRRTNAFLLELSALQCGYHFPAFWVPVWTLNAKSWRSFSFWLISSGKNVTSLVWLWLFLSLLCGFLPGGAGFFSLEPYFRLPDAVAWTGILLPLRIPPPCMFVTVPLGTETKHWNEEVIVAVDWDFILLYLWMNFCTPSWSWGSSLYRRNFKSMITLCSCTDRRAESVISNWSASAISISSLSCINFASSCADISGNISFPSIALFSELACDISSRHWIADA